MTAIDNLLGTDLFGKPIKPNSSGPVADKFLVSPFTALDARSKNWQDRKQAWIRLGIESELGRDDKLLYGKQSGSINYYRVKEGKGAQSTVQRTSIFDPLLCELSYRWFCPKEGQVVDPFAGGSVRGIVAAALGFDYWGCDLSEKQVDANYIQRNKISPESEGLVWVPGDSSKELDKAPDADFIFSCPPYGDLEVYSDDPDDLSNMSHEDFIEMYRNIISKAVDKLKPNRFACFVVGDYRGKDGFYKNFVSDTIEAFEDVGAKLYNEAIMVTPTGSASIRVTKQFNAGRKLCKLHQNVLIFCKGDWKKAAKACIG